MRGGVQLFPKIQGEGGEVRSLICHCKSQVAELPIESTGGGGWLLHLSAFSLSVSPYLSLRSLSLFNYALSVARYVLGS